MNQTTVAVEAASLNAEIAAQQARQQALLTQFENSRAKNQVFVMESRAAIEALRAGVVNRYVVERATYGQAERLARLCQSIDQQKTGSVQVVVGGYGTGKTHFGELLARALEKQDFAVARLELGASHEQAENPRSIVSAVEQSLTLTIDGRTFHGASDLATLLRALIFMREDRLDHWTFGKEQALLRATYDRFPGRQGFLTRFDTLREAIPKYWGLLQSTYLPTLSLSDGVPTDMSAANKAIAKLNWLAHQLRLIDVHGLVLLLDEAERTEWAINSYRVERAWDVMMGLALTAGNHDTRDLKHHRNVRSPVYRPHHPSYMHVVFAFTHQGGLCQQICQRTGIVPEVLSSYDNDDKRQIENQLRILYGWAYGTDQIKPLSDQEQINVWRNIAGDDIRS
ncbi:MAG TPA: DUF2791 family P-loop domain-containing protein, partial [Candidatus Competibacteraceae bacterium]|nr:DUF2791 family P-loop domain-containing protein [Candidatus Competibacteraceae bacterium]